MLRMNRTLRRGSLIACTAIALLCMVRTAGAQPPADEVVLRQSGLMTGDVQLLPPAPPVREAVTIRLTLDGVPMDVLLQPATVRAPGFGAFSLAPDGTRVPIVPPQEGTYIGHVPGLPGARAHISAVPTGWRGVIDLNNGPVWFVQPVVDALDPDDFAPGALDGLHVAYRHDRLSVLARAAACAGAIDIPNEQPVLLPAGRPKGAPFGCVREVRLAIEADAPFVLLNGGTAPPTIADVESVINACNAIFLRDFGMTCVVGSTLIRAPGAPGQTPVDPYTSRDPGTLLSQFRSWWLNNQQAVPRDIAHLFTGRQLTGGVIGVAYLNGLCNTLAYGLSESRWSSNFGRRVTLTAHEIGHNLGANHCDGQSDCAIMCSAVDSCARGAAEFFEATTAAVVRSRLAALGCIPLVSGPGVPVPPRAYDDVFSATNNAPINLDVLVNDLDANCQAIQIGPLPVTSAFGASLARVIGAGPGGRDVIRYTPNPAFTGRDVFTYTITDGTLTSTGVVQVDVSGLLVRLPDSPGFTTPGLGASYYRVNSLSTVPDFTGLQPYAQGASRATINFSGAVGANVLDSGRTQVAGRFRANFSAPVDGLYTFFLTSDDGSVLLVNGRLIVSNDYVHTVREASGTVQLTAGLHPIEIGYFNRSGAFRLTFEYIPPGGTRAIVPATRMPGTVRVDWFLPTPDPTALPSFSLLTPYRTDTLREVNFPSAVGPFATSERTDYTATVLEGFLSVPRRGLWTLSTESDDGSRLFIGDQLVVDNDFIHLMQLRTGEIGLDAGLHRMRVEHFNATGPTGLILRWQGPGTSEQVIPASALARLPRVCGPSDIAAVGQIENPDGDLTADDIILYISWFFALDARADIAANGLLPEPDGLFTADDIIVFINRFFLGC